MGYTLATALLLTVAGVAAPDVTVQPLTGPEFSGQLRSLGNAGLVVETPEGSRELPLSDLLAVRPVSQPRAVPSPAANGAARVMLMDGSLLLAQRYSVADRRATVELAGGLRLEIPTRGIRWVRFREPSDQVDEQWRTIVAQEAAGDVIVIRKSATALDQLEGVLGDVANEKVTFEFDGDEIPVGLEKLEGIVYFHPLGGKPRRPLCKVTTSEGSTWNVDSLAMQDDSVRWTTASGAELRVPLDRVELFDFSSGNVVYLSDLEPASSTWTPFLESPLLAGKLQQLYGPRRDRSFGGEELRLGDRVYRKGLALHSRTELVYRLTDEYRRLQADVGLDDSLRSVGHVELVIFGDDRELYREAIGGRDDPRTLDLDIRGVRRLKILVDFGERLDIADHLYLCNARILK